MSSLKIFNSYPKLFSISFKNDLKQKVPHFREGLSKKGDDILSHITAVPSAQAGLTTLFGMGRGEPRRNNHLKGLVVGFWLSVDEFLQQLSTINQQLLASSKYLNILR